MVGMAEQVVMAATAATAATAVTDIGLKTMDAGARLELVAHLELEV